MKKQSIPPFVFGMGVGAIVLLIVVFAAGWVVTAGAAQKEAGRVAQKAVVEALMPICVAQFKQDPDKTEALKQLKAESTWARGNYVEKQGWATMPGSQSANTDLADECAEKILSLG
jgi:hypothetical protein